jgi:hypothetical protein
MNIKVKNNHFILTESFLLSERITKQSDIQLNKELSHTIAFLQEGFPASVICRADILTNPINKDNVKVVKYLRMELEFPEENSSFTDYQLEEYGELFHAAKLGFVRSFLIY